MDTESTSVLAAELASFEQHRGEWMKQHPNQYVVVKGQKPLGFFESFAAAYRAATVAYGEKADFLVKKVAETEPVFVIY